MLRRCRVFLSQGDSVSPLLISLLESATDAFYHAVRTWKLKFLLDFGPPEGPHASWSARSLALFLHGSISELQEDTNELIVLDFLL